MSDFEKMLSICELGAENKAFYNSLPAQTKNILDILEYDPKTKTLFPNDEVSVPSFIDQIKATYNITTKYGLYRALIWNIDITHQHIFGEGGVMDKICCPFVM